MKADCLVATDAAKTICPVIWDFWEDQFDPKIRQRRIASQDPGQFRALERDETTANGVQTKISDGQDEILVLDVGYLNLRNVLYVDVVQVIHDFNPSKSIPKDKMRRIWTSIVYNMNHYESEDLKAKKLDEMDSQEAKRYWENFGRNLPVKTNQKRAPTMNGLSSCKTCGLSVPHAPPFSEPLPPPPGFDGTLLSLPLQDRTTRGPSVPELYSQAVLTVQSFSQTAQPHPGFGESRPYVVLLPVSPMPSFSQTTQPYPVFDESSPPSVSLPVQETRPLSLGTRLEVDIQPGPPKPLFSQTVRPFSMFTVLLPGQASRPVSFGIPPTWISRPRTYRGLWVPPPYENPFTGLSGSRTIHVPGGS